MRPALITAGAIAGGLLLISIVVLLALTWSELKVSRENIETTDYKIGALLDATEPALDDVPQLVDQAEPVLKDAAPLFGKLLASAPAVGDVVTRLPLVLAGVQNLASEAAPLANSLSAAGLPALVAGLGSSDLPALVDDLRASDLPGLASTVADSDLPATLDSAQQLLGALAADDRLTRNLDVTTALLAEVSALRLPQRAVASSRRLKDLLKVQRDTYDVLVTSLKVQRRTYDRVRSIDDKLGGQIPPLVP